MWLALIAFSGCADSCSCRPGAEGAAAPVLEQKTAAGSAAPTPASASGSAPGTAQAGSAAPPPTTSGPAWVPAADSELTRRLRGAQKAIEQDQAFEKLATPQSLEHVLSDKLGALKADGKVTSTARSTDKNDLIVAARNYRSGETNVRVKITDTAGLPSARRVVSNRLTLIGNESAGDERGAFVRGYPSVLGHVDPQRISRGTALIGGRYLVQIMVQGAAHADDAQRFLEQLDWSALAPKQGKLPDPEPPPPATPAPAPTPAP